MTRLSLYIEIEILEVLKYFHYFSFPLTAQELYMLAAVKTTQEEIDQTLAALRSKNRIEQFEIYYGLSSSQVNGLKRKQNEQRFTDKAKQPIQESAAIIASFPFVRCVALSGSASKQIFPEGADFDFFIVTKKNTLWIARTLLHLFKKSTFILGKQHDFCMNYFVDEENYNNIEQNRYTATELAYLKPIYGKETFSGLMQYCNSWLKEFMPNVEPQLKENLQWLVSEETTPSRIKRMFEFLLNSPKLNHFLMRVSIKRWKRKKPGYKETYERNEYLTLPGISKNHPKSYQKKVLHAIE